MKNHEGYHDPTAGNALKNYHRAKKPPVKKELKDVPFITLGEVPSFRVARAYFAGYRASKKWN